MQEIKLSNSTWEPHCIVPFNLVRAGSPLLTGKSLSVCALSAYYIPALAANKMQEFIIRVVFLYLLTGNKYQNFRLFKCLLTLALMTFDLIGFQVTTKEQDVIQH